MCVCGELLIKKSEELFTVIIFPRKSIVTCPL